MRKIGINLHSVKGCSDSEAAELLASHGFEATFSDTYSAERQVEIAELLAKKGISYDTLHAPFDRINDMWREGEDGERMCKRLIDAVDNCALAGVPTAIVHLSSGVHAPQINDVGMARFTRLVEHAESGGQLAGGIADLDTDDIYNFNQIAFLGEYLLRGIHIVDDQAEDAEILGLGDGECAEVDVVGGEGISDRCQRALSVLNKDG